MGTYGEGSRAERAVVEDDVDHDAVVDIEHAHATILEVNREEVPISKLEGIGDVQRFAITIREDRVVNGGDCAT